MATQLFQADVEICDPAAEAHATSLARTVLCNATANHWDYQHNNWFAQLMTYCDKPFRRMQGISIVGLAWVAYIVPSSNEAQCATFESDPQ
jgi:hypothetical protein